MIAIAQAVVCDSIATNNGALMLTGLEKGRVWPVALHGNEKYVDRGDYFLVTYDPQDQFCHILDLEEVQLMWENEHQSL
jgi:hypothetical protein